MTISALIILILLFIIIVLFLMLRTAYTASRNHRFQRHSLASKYGKMTENFMPFLADYPYDPHNFRFLGNPIDGISFEDDKLVFIEFKAATSRLTPKQMKIRELIENRRVIFEEHRIK